MRHGIIATRCVVLSAGKKVFGQKRFRFEIYFHRKHRTAINANH